MIRRLTLFELLIIGCPIMFFTSATGSLHLSAADLVLPFLLVLELARGVHVPRRGSAVYAVGVFAICAFAATAASAVAAAVSANGFDVSLGASNTLKLVVGLTYAAVVAAQVARIARADLLRALRIWAAVAAVMSLLSMSTVAGIAGLMPSHGVRSAGYFEDPNLYAGYLLISLAVVFLVESMSSSRWTPLLIVVVSGGLVSTASRAGFAVLGGALVLSVVLVNRRRIRWTAVPLLLAFVWLGLAVLGVVGNWLDLPGIERLHQSATAARTDSRFELWSRSLHLWEHHPVFGVGIGQYVRYSSDILGISKVTGTGFVVHNTFLSFLAELGAFGFLLSVGGVIWLAVLVWRASQLDRAIRASLLIGLAVMWAEMMTLNLQNVRYVWIFVGVLLGICRPLSHEPATPAVPSGRSTGTRR